MCRRKFAVVLPRLAAEVIPSIIQPSAGNEQTEVGYGIPVPDGANPGGGRGLFSHAASADDDSK